MASHEIYADIFDNDYVYENSNLSICFQSYNRYINNFSQKF